MSIRSFLKRGPASAHDHFRNGLVYAERKMLREAIQEWRAVTRMDPGNAKAHYNLGLAYYLKDPVGLIDEAVREWQVACDLNPRDANARYNLSVALYHQRGMVGDDEGGQGEIMITAFAEES
jgi:protein O-GlcNAc transferase